MNKFWKWSKDEVSTSNSELIIEGVIAQESWYEDEVSPKQFREELAKHSGDMTVRVNSPGGDVYAGVQIYNALREYNGRVTIKVDGLAASIASVIAMAGDEIQMLPGSQMMVHKPWTVAMGNSDDLEDVVAYLKKTCENIAAIYEKRTGLSSERIAELLETETWLNPQEAVDLGFADLAIEAKQKETTVVDNAYDSIKQSVKDAILVPAMSLQSKLNAQSKEEVEDVSTDDKTETVDETVQNESTNDSEETIEEPTEVEEVETKLTKEKEEKMDDVKNVAVNQVLEPAKQAEVTPQASTKDYLKSKNALNDFADVLAANAGATAADVQAAWKSKVETKMGATNPEVLLPEGVVTAIEDAFKEGGDIWNKVSKTNLDVLTTAVDTVTGEDSRAKGHKRGTNKQEEVITLAKRTVRAQFIYKYLTLDKETVRENKSTGALLRYVLSELPKRIVREIERAIVIGDGRDDASDLKINSFVSLKAEAADASSVYATTYTPAAGEGKYETMVKALAEVKADGTRYLVAKAGFLTDAMLQKNDNGGFLFAPGTNLATAFSLGGIITPDWMDDDAENDAYIVTLGNYKTVGDTSIESFSNFVLAQNKNEYLQEIYTGGALAARNAAVAIAVAV